jgi:hypothetical protein
MFLSNFNKVQGQSLNKNFFLKPSGYLSGYIFEFIRQYFSNSDSHIKSKLLGVDITLERYGPLEMSTEDEEEIQVEEQTPQRKIEFLLSFSFKQILKQNSKNFGSHL